MLKIYLTVTNDSIFFVKKLVPKYKGKYGHLMDCVSIATTFRPSGIVIGY